MLASSVYLCHLLSHCFSLGLSLWKCILGESSAFCLPVPLNSPPSSVSLASACGLALCLPCNMFPPPPFRQARVSICHFCPHQFGIGKPSSSIPRLVYSTIIGHASFLLKLSEWALVVLRRLGEKPGSFLKGRSRKYLPVASWDNRYDYGARPCQVLLDL